MIKRKMLPVLFATVLAFTACKTSAPGGQPVNSEMDRFITNLMKQMTLDEKIGQLNLLTPGGGILTGSVVNADVESKIKSGKLGGLFGVIGVDKVRQAQELAVNGSRLKIPLIFGSDIIHGYKTTFPIPLALSTSWDMKMIEHTARTAANEATADGLCWNFSPMVDISRDPRWGRIAEGAGEDPYLGSQISAAMVRGYQGTDLTADSTLMACVKHFALYGAPEAGRDYGTVDMSRVRMYEYYFPPYKAAVDAGVGSVMTSFNEIDGVPATANKWLMTDVLRNQWGFNGFVVTDYTAINEMIDHGLGDLQTVSALALKAGTDMDMVGEGFLNTLQKSLDEGKISVSDIDQACRRVLEAKYKLGLFSDPFRYTNKQRAEREVLNAEKRNLSRHFAARSMVLLKNDNQVLPLKKTGSIALVGPLANNTSNMLGTWAVSGDNKTSIPVLQGIKNVAGNNLTVTYAKGANITDDTLLAKRANVFGERVSIDKRSADEMISEAVSVANNSDVVVAVLGEASEFSGEASSRSDISLPPSQVKLLHALKKTGKPLVVVLMTGRPLTIEEEKELPDGILLSWFPGHEAGNAIADVLFGNYNPSGKLTMTWPRNVGQIPIYYNHKRTGRPQVDSLPAQKFRSNYLDVANTPLYPFGYGLSYTNFAYGGINLSKTSMTPGETITATITVTNSGNYDGEEVVQLYLRDVYASITPAVKQLKGFEKVFLRKGESKQVSFTISEDMLKFYNNDLQLISEAGDFIVFIGGSSATTNQAKFSLVK